MRLWPIALLSAAAAGAAPFPPDVAIPGGFGVNIHFTDPRPGEMEMLAASGVKWVRMDFVWGATEREKGVYDFSAYDRLVAALGKHGLKALFILDYGNRHYDGGASPASDEGRQAFARWAAEGVKHFRGRGFIWEMWNEPNIGFWKPEPNVTNYIALARETGRAIREAAPGEWYVGPATSRIDLPFLEACFKGGLLDYWDAVTVHPYRHESGPETVAREYGQLRDLIARYAPAGRDIPILSGEWGYTAAWARFDETSQGAMLARQWLANTACGIPLSIWYDWHDDGRDPKEAEHHFGTVAHEYHAGRDPVYDPKPAYRAARTFTGLLGGFRYAGRAPLFRGGAEEEAREPASSPDDWALLFENGDTRMLAAWTTSEKPVTAWLAARAGPIGVTNHVGEALPALAALDGRVALTLTGHPLYLAFPRGHSPSSGGAGTARRWTARLFGRPAAPPYDWQDERISAALLSVQPDGSACAIVEKAFGDAFDGDIEISSGGRVLSLTPLRMKAGAATATVSLPPRDGGFLASPVSLRVRRNDGATVFQTPPRRTVPLAVLTADDAAARFRVEKSGDGTADAVVSVAWEPAPPGLPTAVARAVRIDLAVEKGPRYVRLFPLREADRAIEGRPVAMGLWTRREGSDCRLTLRFADANGEVFQPPQSRVESGDWRYLEIPLTGHLTHWGAKSDGVIDGPLRWDTIILVDRPAERRAEATVWVASPSLVY